MKAVLLAGGRGTRLRPLTDDIPKSMVPVCNKPILQWQLEWLKAQGVSEFVLSLGHLPDRVRDHFGDGGDFGVSIQYAVEDEPLGTAGGLRRALEVARIDGPFFATNGDVLTNLNPGRLEAQRRALKAVGGISLVALTSPYGIVEMGGNGLVRSFREKPTLPDYWLSAGVYSFGPEILSYLPVRGSLEHEVFPLLSRRNLLAAYKFDSCLWRSIDGHKDLEEASEHMASMADPTLSATPQSLSPQPTP